MFAAAAVDLSALYEVDETAWLDSMAVLIEQGEFADLDYFHLAEYLADMARRDRREVTSRLVVLLLHLLKWHYQLEQRSNSWRGSIVAQRQSLRRDASSGVLRAHAESVLPEAYADALEVAAEETGMPRSHFPVECPYTIEELLTADLLAETP